LAGGLKDPSATEARQALESRSIELISYKQL
jgi:hypothetical protein